MSIEDRVIVDAGSKMMAMGTGWNSVPKHRDDVEFSLGDRIEFITSHVYTTINLHNGIVEDIWNVQGRGKIK